VRVPAGEGAAHVLLLNAEYAVGDPEAYVLPVARATGAAADAILHNAPALAIARLEQSDGGQALLYDAMADRDFARALLAAIEAGTVFRGTHGTLAARPTPAFGALRGPASLALEPSLSKAEHSNTAVIYGDRMLLKVFRRPEPGVNPDVEIGGYLTGRHFPHVPMLGGTLEYRSGGQTRSLAILTQFIPGATDGWDYTLDALGRYFDRVLLFMAENRPCTPPGGSLLAVADTEPSDDVVKAIGTYLESGRLLGERTAELHLALGASEEPDFAPEPFSPHYQRSLYQSMRNLVMENFELLKKQTNRLPAALQDDARAILAGQGVLLSRYQRLYTERLEACRIRVHGDYHLGQVLSTGTDFVILDFEGEPARALSARRLKRSPIADVAGMLRSFHYAVHTGLHAQANRGLLNPENQRGLAEWAVYWRRWVSGTYLRAYLATMGDSPLLPKNRAELEVLLDAYLLDKAVYEIGYELNNRPEWLAIPFQGILQHLRGAL
jgi:maltose alpha-D-glucosyltransferase / alpha-amylase